MTCLRVLTEIHLLRLVLLELGLRFMLPSLMAACTGLITPRPRAPMCQALPSVGWHHLMYTPISIQRMIQRLIRQTSPFQVQKFLASNLVWRLVCARGTLQIAVLDCRLERA